ncbi:MAG: universal stress protein [Salegentibacter sp.]
MKNILVPTDFSENAWNALQYAISLFENDRVAFYLLNAYHSHYFTTDTLLVPENVEVAYEKARTTSEQGLKELLIRLEPYKNENHSFKTVSIYNATVEAVSEVTKKYKIKLVVMGTMGENDALDKVYGTNAVNVMKKIHRCPVLVIPEHASYHKSGKKEVVFATNFRDTYRKRTLKYLPEIAKNYSASLRILYIQETERSLDQAGTL